MIPDIDIWRSANLLIKQYGDDAYFMAAQLADALLEKGDMDGCRVWKRTLKATEELERVERKTWDALN